MAIATDVGRVVEANQENETRRVPSAFVPWPDAVERGRIAAMLVALACFCFFLFGASRGWSHNLSDRHGFRQTQTAISA